MRNIFQNEKDGSLSVIVPVFNEGVNVLENLELIQIEVSKYFSHYEIIVISDGSTDQTNEKLKTIFNNYFRIVVLSDNHGKGFAVRKGFEIAKNDFILFIDGGLELHPKEIKIFFGLMKIYDADIVIGSKRHPQSVVYYPVYRRFLSFVFQGLVKVLLDINLTDTQVGLKIFKSKVVKSILPYLEINSYGFDLELLGVARKLGYQNILEAPVRLDYFYRRNRPFFWDFMHTLIIGFYLLIDTIKVWRKLKKISEY